MAKGPRYLIHYDVIHFLDITHARNTMVCAKVYIHLPLPLLQVFLEGQDFYLFHLCAFYGALYPVGAQ